MDTPLLSAQYYGDSGGSQVYYYWIQGVYPWGYGPLSNVAQVTTLSLGHNNVVSLNWQPLPGVTYVNVYRSTSATPPTGTSTLGIQKALATADGLVDNGLPTFSIVVGAAGPALMGADDEEKKIAESESEKINKEIDKLLEDYEKDMEEAEQVDLEAQERARKLDQLYKERFQLPVRLTDSQKEAKEARKDNFPQPHKKDAEKQTDQKLTKDERLMGSDKDKPEGDLVAAGPSRPTQAQLTGQGQPQGQPRPSGQPQAPGGKPVQQPHPYQTPPGQIPPGQGQGPTPPKPGTTAPNLPKK